MSDARLARARNGGRGRRVVHPDHQSALQTGTSTTITPLAAANDVVRWIPTEAIALYLAFYAGIFGSGASSTATDFATRWQFFGWAGLGGTAVLVVLIYTAKWRLSAAANAKWEFPLFEILLADIAFAGWALALPASPALQWSRYGDWFPEAMLVLVTTLVPLIGSALGLNPPTYVEPVADGKKAAPAAVAVAANGAPDARPGKAARRAAKRNA
jgi:hypothetical protein